MKTRVRKTGRLLLSTVVGLALAHSARAGEVVWNPATGHYYQSVPSALAWIGARDAAEAATYLGMQGHLATISDDAEDFWIQYTMNGSQLGNYWIGLWQDLNDPSYSEPAGGWKWVTDEPFAYIHWKAGEPNDAGGGEHYGGYYGGYAWNDYINDGSVLGYVIEYEPALGTRYCLSEPNSTGFPALIYAGGTGSIAANDLLLQAGSIPTGSPSLFFYGETQIQAPFGNGWRCVGGHLYLLHPVARPVDGWLIRAVDFESLPPGGEITAGSTWNFQAWFRDRLAGGGYFDTSDALSITFVPCRPSDGASRLIRQRVGPALIRAGLLEYALGDAHRAPGAQRERQRVARPSVDHGRQVEAGLVQHDLSEECVLAQVDDVDAHDVGAERLDEGKGELVGERTARLVAGHDALDLERLVRADDDRETSLPAALAEVDPLLVDALADDDARESDVDHVLAFALILHRAVSVGPTAVRCRARRRARSRRTELSISPSLSARRNALASGSSKPQWVQRKPRRSPGSRRSSPASLHMGHERSARAGRNTDTIIQANAAPKSPRSAHPNTAMFPSNTSRAPSAIAIRHSGATSQPRRRALVRSRSAVRVAASLFCIRRRPHRRLRVGRG